MIHCFLFLLYVSTIILLTLPFLLTGSISFCFKTLKRHVWTVQWLPYSLFFKFSGQESFSFQAFFCCCFSSLNFIACMLKCILFHCWRDLFESCCFSCFNYSVMLNCILFLCWRKLFESSASMNTTAVKSLMSALHQLSSQHISGRSQLSGQQIVSISFSVERMASILVNNLHSGFFLYLEHSFR